MTITYQPSAAGISWLVLSEVLSNREEMAEDLLKLSAENSKVQINLSEATADQTLKELSAAAEGQRQNAIFTLSGAGAGIGLSIGTFAGAIATRPQEETSSVKNSIELEEKSSLPPLSKIDDQLGEVELQGENKPAPTSSTSKEPTEEKETKQPQASPLHRYLTDHGYLLANTTQTGIQSLGGLQQAKYTAIQAEEKSLEVIAQGIASVMNTQGGMLSSAVGSSDTFFNNTEGAITTIIQVSAIRG